MKRLYSLASALALGATALMAQTMIVADKSGEQHRFGVDRIAQITFEEVADANVIQVKPTYIQSYGGGNAQFTFNDDQGKNMILLDFYGSTEATYLEEGTYTLNADNTPFSIDPKYSKFMPDGADGARETLNSGKMTVADNEGVYTIDIEFTTTEGSNIKAHYQGELASYSSKPAEVTTKEVTMSACKKMDIDNPEAGEYYLKLNDPDWYYEMTLDLFADPDATSLPAGTYILNRSTDHTSGTITYQKSSVDIYQDPSVPADKRGNVRFSEATLTVTKSGNTYNLVLETTLMNELQYKFTFNGEISGM